jgi:hypothetical protein
MWEQLFVGETMTTSNAGQFLNGTMPLPTGNTFGQKALLGLAKLSLQVSISLSPCKQMGLWLVGETMHWGNVAM